MRITGAILEEIGRSPKYRESQPIRVCELDLASPGAGEVLVRMEAAGLCHSDLSVVNGNRVRPVPMLLGHEAVARIEEVGEGAHGFKVGERVVLTFLPSCGRCEGCATAGIRPCVEGTIANTAGTLVGGHIRLARDSESVFHHLGVSAFATHAVVSTRSLVRMPDDVPADIAAVMGCAALTGGGAILNVASPLPGAEVIVVGLGGVGLAAALTAMAHEGVKTVAVDTVPSKLSLAESLGIEVFTPDDIVLSGRKAKFVIEATGNASALELAVQLTEAGGKTISVGLPAPEARISLSPTALVAEGRSLIGSYLGSAVPQRDIPVFIDLWRKGKLPLEAMISHHIRIEDINEAMDNLAEGKAIRQIITF